MRGSGGRSRPPVGSRGKAPGRGSWRFFSVCHHKKQHSGAWKSDICKSASFMFRPDIYLVMLKIALKMSFWCSKNKILAKVPNYLTATVSWDTSVKNIYSGTAVKLVSTEFQIHRGVRQGDPLSPKLFTAVMEEVFKKAEISEGVNVDGENLSNLRFADRRCASKWNNKTNGKTHEQSKLRKHESWLKDTQRKDKVHDTLCGQRRHTNRSAKNWKSDRIQIPRTNHTP